MEDNIINEQQNEVTGEQSGMPEKKVRIGYIFLSVVPLAVLVVIQTVAQIPFLIMASVDAVTGTDISGDAFDIYDKILEIFKGKYAIYAYLIYSAVGVAVFTIWYYKGFVKKNPKVRLGEVFGVKSILAATGLAIGLFFIINAALTLAQWLFPRAIEDYNEMLEMAGIVSDPVLTVIYGLILGPIVEELCFRGVTYAIIERSGVRPWICILIPSLFFGGMHLIPVQVAYATVLGLFLGYLRYKYRSVAITIATHMLFNFFGTFVSEMINGLGFTDGLALIFGGVSLFIVVFVIVLINGDKKAFKPASNS